MGKTSAVFAGQGAQFVGMGKDLADAYPACADVFKRADDVLGFGISQICFDGPEDELTKSSNCQPAIFTASVACYTALQEATGGVEFEALAGLSLGEWTALHVGGALGFDDTLRVLEARGRYMQEACDACESGMVSVIGLSLEQLKEICAQSGTEIANLNSDAQIVLSGTAEAVAKAETLAKEAGAKRAIVLKVAGAFHSSLMDSAAEKLAAFLADVEISTPTKTVLSNVTGKPHTTPAEIKQAMVNQVNHSVLWFDCVKWFLESGTARFIECGSGKVLSGLIKRIDRSVDCHSVQDATTLAAAAESLK